ncbi:MAG: NADH-quinone oxidoreductase subunit NuoE [Phreatobacter sp.]|uniref:NADH-quinone oxidoreductase subunit NuoE n=1 Tax=Phreatobacter sp. TaxID=1966341 RepID=UPI0027339CC8|nr:NADH-quinone oxidoreductase subunit NuoE [Phreatobacter sp.]MDP2802900.1 NADH-quinone oxidoreductase subunit NuoE [Phreatobacter sp.]
MSVRRLAPDEVQPASFAFTPDNLAWAQKTVGNYPSERKASAVIPLLWRAQEQHAYWLPKAAIEYIADMLDMPYIRVFEVATFYTMFQLQPVGKKAHVQVCGTTPCMLRGAEALIKVCKSRIHHEPFHLSDDGDFSWEEVECAGACVNAPMIQVFSDTYEDLTPESLEKVLDAFARGEKPAPGPQNGRHGAEPEGGALTLRDLPYDAAAPGGAMVAEKKVAERPVADTGPSAEALALAAREEADIKAKLATLAADATPEQKADAVGIRPQGLPAAREAKADKLQQVKGIGPVNEGKLNALGIFHFDQIAALTREEIRWVGTYLSFPGRIDREEWTVQAKALAAGLPSVKE